MKRKGNYSAPLYEVAPTSGEAGLRRCTHEGLNQGLKDISALLMHGGAIGADDAAVLRALQCAKAARDDISP